MKEILPIELLEEKHLEVLSAIHSITRQRIDKDVEELNEKHRKRKGKILEEIIYFAFIIMGIAITIMVQEERYWWLYLITIFLLFVLIKLIKKRKEMETDLRFEKIMKGISEQQKRSEKMHRTKENKIKNIRLKIQSK